ncbi:Uncharacterised protein [Mycobacteroides abscessus subsp. massiliense]|nr:Uncharacterised protein [Mycobacteroides abscessus subsp. massiliense]
MRGGGGSAPQFVVKFQTIEVIPAVMVVVAGGHVVVVADVLIMQVHLVLFALG